MGWPTGSAGFCTAGFADRRLLCGKMSQVKGPVEGRLGVGIFSPTLRYGELDALHEFPN
jgi:hypothetical protein